MGIFSNYKLNSLRKNVEGRYESRLENIALSLGQLPQERRLELATKLGISLEANAFAKTMNFSLFHPEYGVFQNDVDNLNELNFDDLYKTMVVWYSWARAPFDSGNEKNQKSLDICKASIEAGFGIDPLVTQSYYAGLTENMHLADFALYRWCMLTIGHVDIHYETMHENSPECELFIRTAHLAKEEAGKALD